MRHQKLNYCEENEKMSICVIDIENKNWTTEFNLNKF